VQGQLGGRLGLTLVTIGLGRPNRRIIDKVIWSAAKYRSSNEHLQFGVDNLLNSLICYRFHPSQFSYITCGTANCTSFWTLLRVQPNSSSRGVFKGCIWLAMWSFSDVTQGSLPLSLFSQIYNQGAQAGVILVVFTSFIAASTSWTTLLFTGEIVNGCDRRG